MRNKRVNIIGVNISVVNMETALDELKDNFIDARGNYICVSNVHTTVTAHNNEDYRKIQNESFMSLPDGKPLSVIGKLRNNKEMGRVTGPEFLEKILSDNRFSKYNHFFYGNTEDNLNKFINCINNKYKDINICGYECSKFRDLTNDEQKELEKKINESKADFVWVSLGAPKQEFFCANMCNKTRACWIGVGGAFNVISGVIPRAPKWMQKLSLEWLFRLIQEPKRLFKRYLITNTQFIYYLILSMFKMSKDE